eukprot:CAMPEP_0168423128 /NCGR_PEP_ID=MMETSP0228-20121227/34148_1 /TAXON_ID=133427 /ORGANISM="Protoceratium reticulatum, Strain CCCM 535 (=CCMP 1889)" /LENGTH=154 /DNA_ID=CAMNT_0008437079 /DNA_START=37 /DNA_END=498 /DNA_ORIENTATION=-
MGCSSTKHVEAPRPVLWHMVRLAATPFGPAVQSMQAYHTSVAVGDLEYSFSGRGICTMANFGSHSSFSGKTEVMKVGDTIVPPHHMIAVLSPYFPPGTYDLLRKNCNSFSDCCLSFVLGTRLDDGFRVLEKIGKSVDRHASVVQAVMGGKYTPN